MRALTGGSIPRGYRRLLGTIEGGRLAYEREELIGVLGDRDYLKSLPPDSVGYAYWRFTEEQSISAKGLVDASQAAVEDGIELLHPYAWYGRRLRDIHDIWHVLTGYGRDPLGEVCVVAFSFAQTRSWGFAFIAIVGGLRVARDLRGQPVLSAAWRAFRDSRKAAWLPGEDYRRLLSEPLNAARRRLNIAVPETYLSVPAEFRQGALAY
jgi:ubiquinone biosynthesis protein COQ4